MYGAPAVAPAATCCPELVMRADVPFDSSAPHSDIPPPPPDAIVSGQRANNPTTSPAASDGAGIVTSMVRAISPLAVATSSAGPTTRRSVVADGAGSMIETVTTSVVP